jgi:hypothetical protein
MGTLHRRHVAPRRAHTRPGASASREPRSRQHAAAVLAVLAVLAVGFPAAATGGFGSQPTAEVILPDTEAPVSRLVEVVRGAARRVPATVPDAELRIVFVGDVPDADATPFVAGLQRDTTVWVRVDGAMPTRTLLHELAHAVTPGTGHGDGFRAVYLAAIEEVYGRDTAAREARRLAWVYDRCYRDGSCPEVPRDAPGSPASPEDGR